MERKIVRIHVKDQVGVAITALSKDAIATVISLDGVKHMLTVVDDIPEGHKVALTGIKKDQVILKYGEEIGRAICDIFPGEHVHIHNLVSKRGGITN